MTNIDMNLVYLLAGGIAGGAAVVPLFKMLLGKARAWWLAFSTKRTAAAEAKAQAAAAVVSDAVKVQAAALTARVDELELLVKKIGGLVH